MYHAEFFENKTAVRPLRDGEDNSIKRVQCDLCELWRTAPEQAADRLRWGLRSDGTCERRWTCDLGGLTCSEERSVDKEENMGDDVDEQLHGQSIVSASQPATSQIEPAPRKECLRVGDCFWIIHPYDRPKYAA